jgi:large subunit ribosomal protein L17
MRHGLGYRKLNKTSEHRKALFKNMLNSLIKYEQIITTLPKAKELKPQIDKVITIGKKIFLVIRRDFFQNYRIKNQLRKFLMNSPKDIVLEKVVIQESLKQALEQATMHQWQ